MTFFTSCLWRYRLSVSLFTLRLPRHFTDSAACRLTVQYYRTGKEVPSVDRADTPRIICAYPNTFRFLPVPPRFDSH